jgi:hypothetical protein
VSSETEAIIRQIFSEGEMTLREIAQAAACLLDEAEQITLTCDRDGRRLTRIARALHNLVTRLDQAAAGEEARS